LISSIEANLMVPESVVINHRLITLA
jgi:hypothetical protein